jgi:hypothetical protein
MAVTTTLIVLHYPINGRTPNGPHAALEESICGSQALEGFQYYNLTKYNMSREHNMEAFQ